MGILLLLLLLAPGPAETLSGKYVPRPPRPLPMTLPTDAAALCELVESGHETAPLFAALGEALLASGERGLAFRAFDRANRLGQRDLQARKDLCVYVPEAVIRAEEREAAIWREALDSYRRARGEDLREFFEQYGRPEESLDAIIRMARISWAGGVFGLLLGLAFAVGTRRLPRRAAALPLAAAILAGTGALLMPRPGLLPLGAGACAVGGVLVLLFGRIST